LALSRKLQRAAGKPPRYAGTCTKLSKAEVAEKIAAGLKPTLRFSMAHEQVIEFTDLVRGAQKFQAKDIGDFIIRRTDGTSPFMFCNAIDDSLMGVTHALRGEDHLTNTPCQIAILNALGLRCPQYGHINLIVGNDGSPLSKRHGSRSVQELRALGYLPAAINNYLARLGHHYSNDNFMSFDELAEQFNTNALSKSPARFDLDQLNYWQKEAVQRLNESEFWQWLVEVKPRVPAEQQSLFVQTIKPNIRFVAEANEWAKILFADELEYSAEQNEIMKQAGKEYFAESLSAVAEFGQDYKKIIEVLQAKLGIKGKALFQPLRVALTGQAHGPELAPILQMMSLDLIKSRLERAAAC
jgi:glutamyl-tRNA synthetase